MTISDITRFHRRRYLKAVALVTLTTSLDVGMPQARAAASPPATLLVVGDSISAEYGLERGSGWVQLLRERLKSQQAQYNVINASISGDTTSNGLARLPPLLAQLKPQVVLIELGGNDGLRGLPVASARQNLAKMIALSRAAGASVVLTGIQLPPNYGPQYTQAFAAMYAELAHSEHASLVPFLFQGFAEDRELFQGDHIHPSVQAQPIMLENIWPVLKPLLITGHGA